MSETVVRQVGSTQHLPIDAHIGGVNGLREADVDGGDEHAMGRRWVDGLVKVELQKVHDGILVMMDKNIVTSESTGESKVFDYKMKGDYHGHFAHFGTGDAESRAAQDARVAYFEDTKIAGKDAVVTVLAYFNDFIGMNTPVLPGSGWMGDDFSKKSENVAWWKGTKVSVEMKLSFCPCVAFLGEEVGCTSQCLWCVSCGRVCCFTGVVGDTQLASSIFDVMKFGASANEVKKEDLETHGETNSCRVEAAVSTSSISDSEVAEFQVDLVRRDDELKILTTDQEDLDLDENAIVENPQVTDLSEHERILHVHIGQKVLVLSVPLVLHSAGNILMQVSDTLVLSSLEMFGVSFV